MRKKLDKFKKNKNKKDISSHLLMEDTKGKCTHTETIFICVKIPDIPLVYKKQILPHFKETRII